MKRFPIYAHEKPNQKKRSQKLYKKYEDTHEMLCEDIKIIMVI